MGSVKIAKPHLFRSIKTAHHCALNQPFSCRMLFCRPICGLTRPLDSQFSPLPDQTYIVDRLISVFTSTPICLESQELENFGSRLTTSIVEDVLKRFKSWKFALVFFSWSSSQPGYRHSCYTYNAMAEILARARQNAPLRALAKDLPSSGCRMTPGALGFFIRCLGIRGMVEEANIFFDQIREVHLCTPNVYSYNCLLDAISKFGSTELIEKRLGEMHELGLQLDKYSLTPVLKCYCNSGKFEEALAVFNQMYELGWVDGHAYSILMLAFSKLGEVDKAYELISRMDELKINLNERTFYVLIHGFAKESRIDKALELMDKMLKLGFVPDISIFDVLIGGLCKRREIEKALHLFSLMKKLGVCADVKILAELVSSLPEEAQMLQLLDTRYEDLGKEARCLLYNSILKGLVNNGSVEKAYRLLRVVMGDEASGDLEEKLFLSREFLQPNTTSFEIVVTGLCQVNKLDVALSLFRDMNIIGCKHSELLYNNLIECLSNLNKLEECFNLLQEMKDSGFRPTHFTHNSIFGCLCRRGDPAGALDIVREMRTYGHDPWIKYSTILVKKLCKHGKAAEAWDFLAKMVQEGFLPDLIPYSAAIDGFIENNELEQALELFRNICGLGCFPDVVCYNILIKGLCRERRLLEARDFFNEMTEKGLIPSVATYNLLIDGWIKIGDIDQAMRYFEMMEMAEAEPNVITYTTVVDGLLDVGRPDDAIRVWKEMTGKKCYPNRISFMALIYGLCKCGREDDALLYLHEMEGKEMNPDPYVYISLLDAFISRCNPTMAFTLLKQLVHRGSFPDSNDKHHLILKEAIIKLSADVSTSSGIRSFVADGSIPRCFTDTIHGIDSKPDP